MGILSGMLIVAVAKILTGKKLSWSKKTENQKKLDEQHAEKKPQIIQRALHKNSVIHRITTWITKLYKK